MPSSRLGLHWIRTHPDPEDIPHIERMQYRSAKLFEWHWSDANASRELLAVMPTDSFFLLRDHPMSEQKSDMESNPVGTGIRHANEWVQKWRSGRVHTPVERSFCLGINEADSNHLQSQINDYNTAFLRRLSEHGLRGAGGSFGVGHPSTENLDPNGVPDWSHYEDMHRAIVEGQHILVIHEYGIPANHGWGYWCDRIRHCPWHDVTIVVGECGIDSGVVGDRPNKGWLHYGLTPDQYAAWLDVYMAQLDSRVHSVMPFTYDFSHPWQSFDVRPARQAFEAHQWKSPQPIEPPTPPVISPGPTEPPEPPVQPQPTPTGILDPRVLLAILEVESGAGFIGGRMVIRFEAHVFQRRLNDDRWFNQHFRYGDPPWTGQQMFRAAHWTDIHTGDQKTEYWAFELAASRNRTAALQSISMGRAQVMGFNHARIGYATPEAMYDSFSDGDYGLEAQIVGMLNFVLSDPALRVAIKAKDFRTIARLYNGPGAVDTYAPLLQAAYNRIAA